MLKYVFFEENESQDQLEKKLKNIIGNDIEVHARVPEAVDGIKKLPCVKRREKTSKMKTPKYYNEI